MWDSGFFLGAGRVVWVWIYGWMDVDTWVMSYELSKLHIPDSHLPPISPPAQTCRDVNIASLITILFSTGALGLGAPRDPRGRVVSVWSGNEMFVQARKKESCGVARLSGQGGMLLWGLRRGGVEKVEFEQWVGAERRLK